MSELLLKPFNLKEHKMDTFMDKKVSLVKENLYKLEEELVCTKEEIDNADNFPFGVLYKELDNGLLNIKYVKCGYHERHMLTQEMFNGTILDTDLTYTENGMFESVIETTTCVDSNTTYDEFSFIDGHRGKHIEKGIYKVEEPFETTLREISLNENMNDFGVLYERRHSDIVVIYYFKKGYNCRLELYEARFREELGLRHYGYFAPVAKDKIGGFS